MKRCLAILLSILMLMLSIPMVSADIIYNDDQLNWDGMYDPTVPCTHRTCTRYEAVASTCVTAGHGAYAMCNDCGIVLEGSNATLPLLDHTYDNACDAECNGCGAVREVNPHTYKSEVVVAATCGRNGQMKYTCSDCGDNYTEVIPALGHTEVVMAGKDATCTESGLTEGKKCSVCDVITVAQQIIPAKGHTEVVMAGKDATCTETGLTEGKKCSVCGVILVAQQTISVKEHDYDDEYDFDCNDCGFIRDVTPKGDANGDGRVNNHDLGCLQQYINERPVSINIHAVDLDGNGRLNNRDLGLMQRYLNSL